MISCDPGISQQNNFWNFVSAAGLVPYVVGDLKFLWRVFWVSVAASHTLQNPDWLYQTCWAKWESHGMPRLEQRCEDWIFGNLNTAKQSENISVYLWEWGSKRPCWLNYLISTDQILVGA